MIVAPAEMPDHCNLGLPRQANGLQTCRIASSYSNTLLPNEQRFLCYELLATRRQLYWQLSRMVLIAAAGTLHERVTLVAVVVEMTQNRTESMLS